MVITKLFTKLHTRDHTVYLRRSFGNLGISIGIDVGIGIGIAKRLFFAFQSFI